jgi:hypothetical protein
VCVCVFVCAREEGQVCGNGRDQGRDEGRDEGRARKEGQVCGCMIVRTIAFVTRIYAPTF